MYSSNIEVELKKIILYKNYQLSLEMNINGIKFLQYNSINFDTLINHLDPFMELILNRLNLILLSTEAYNCYLNMNNNHTNNLLDDTKDDYIMKLLKNYFDIVNYYINSSKNRLLKLYTLKSFKDILPITKNIFIIIFNRLTNLNYLSGNNSNCGNNTYKNSNMTLENNFTERYDFRIPSILIDAFCSFIQLLSNFINCFDDNNILNESKILNDNFISNNDWVNITKFIFDYLFLSNLNKEYTLKINNLNNNNYNINNNISININIDMTNNRNKSVNTANNKNKPKKKPISIKKEDIKNNNNNNLIFNTLKSYNQYNVKKTPFHIRIKSENFGFNKNIKNNNKNYNNKLNNNSVINNNNNKNFFNSTGTAFNPNKTAIDPKNISIISIENNEQKKDNNDHTLSINTGHHVMNNRSIQGKKNYEKKRDTFSPKVNRELLNQKQNSILNYSIENRKYNYNHSNKTIISEIKNQNMKNKNNFRDTSSSPFIKNNQISLKKKNNINNNINMNNKNINSKKQVVNYKVKSPINKSIEIRNNFKNQKNELYERSPSGDYKNIQKLSNLKNNAEKEKEEEKKKKEEELKKQEEEKKKLIEEEKRKEEEERKRQEEEEEKKKREEEEENKRKEEERKKEEEKKKKIEEEKKKKIEEKKRKKKKQKKEKKKKKKMRKKKKKKLRKKKGKKKSKIKKKKEQ